jgi:hypothetical protein
MKPIIDLFISTKPETNPTLDQNISKTGNIEIPIIYNTEKARRTTAHNSNLGFSPTLNLFW